jgi:hypothetical protein
MMTVPTKWMMMYWGVRMKVPRRWLVAMNGVLMKYITIESINCTWNRTCIPKNFSMLEPFQVQEHLDVLQE